MPGTYNNYDKCVRTECYCGPPIVRPAEEINFPAKFVGPPGTYGPPGTNPSPPSSGRMKSCELSYANIGMSCKYPLPDGCKVKPINCGEQVEFYHENPKLSATCRPLGPPACVIG